MRVIRFALLLTLPFGVGSVSADVNSTVVIRVVDAQGQALAGASLLARCPEGGSWQATADQDGYAVITEVPACPLSVETLPESPDARVRIERLDGRIVASFSERLMRDLPSSANAWSLLETAEPAAILDRIDGAGLYLGEPGRFSLRGASWTQNTVLLDGTDLTDPLRGGTPLAWPETLRLERIEAVSALAPVEQAQPGVAVALASRSPARAWEGTVQGELVSEGLQAEPQTGAPPIARFGSLAEAEAFVSGPLGSRLGLSVSVTAGRARRFERAEPEAVESRVLSGTGELVYQAGDREELHVLASAQGVRRPFAGRALFLGAAPAEEADVLGLQARWKRALTGATVSAYAGFWGGRVEPQTAGRAAGRPVEQTLDGPVGELIFPPRSRRNVASAGANVARRASRKGGLWHVPRAGVSFRRVSSAQAAGDTGPIPETVGGLPAHVWDYMWSGVDSRRRVSDLALWAADRIILHDRLFVEAGLRVERSAGAADGAAQDVSWTTLSPRVSARLRLAESGRLTVLGGYADYRHALWLDPLGFGDPNAPQAAVYLWDDPNHDGQFQPDERGALVARVGPGAGDGTLTAIDPALRPPRTREFVGGLEWSPGKDWTLRLIGVDRRERDRIESVDVGVPSSGYSVRYIPDPSGDILGAQDDQLLPVYERRPETFGLDRYLLTNPAGRTSRHQAVELRVERAAGERFVLLAGATASRTELAGANRGFRVTENDQGVLGELYDDPNADTHSYGRGFFDRAFTLKIAAAYRASEDWRLGVVARYQDGQPFGRLVIVGDLAQGPEAIPATPRGQIARGGAVDEEGRYLVPSGHRFSFTLSVDARVEKGLRLGSRRLSLCAEAFNLLGTRNEVEESTLWGPAFRTTTAVQPPRAVALRLRLDF